MSSIHFYCSRRQAITILESLNFYHSKHPSSRTCPISLDQFLRVVLLRCMYDTKQLLLHCPINCITESGIPADDAAEAPPCEICVLMLTSRSEEFKNLVTWLLVMYSPDSKTKNGPGGRVIRKK
uniref:Uncharacterized protein n=1 Tax=Clytia hemisphaerica TaxID=252671 RepID=A0A7M5XLP6_9CNID